MNKQENITSTLYTAGPFREEEAQAFYRQFVANSPSCLAWFENELSVAGIQWDGLVESLDNIVKFVVSKLSDPRPANRPIWFNDELASRFHMSDYGAALAAGLVYFTAEIYRREIGARWMYLDDPKHGDHQRPLMTYATIGPPWMAISAVARVADGRDPVTRWSQRVRFCIDQTRALGDDALRSSTSEPLPLEVTVTPAELDGFTWQLWVDEAAEFELGRTLFDSLVDRFAAIEGVREVVQEDREIFLLVAPSTDRFVIEKQCQAILTELSG